LKTGENRNEITYPLLFSHGFDKSRIYGPVLNNVKFTRDGVEFHLIDIHFHRKAEHVFSNRDHLVDESDHDTIRRIREPLECHCVFADQHSNTPQAVFGFIFVESDVRCKLLDLIPFQKHLNNPVEEGLIGLPFNISEHLFDLLDPSRDPSTVSSSFFHYSGSLTTPPCSSSIKWFLKYSFATADQISWFDHLLHESPDHEGVYRVCQPMRNRVVQSANIQMVVSSSSVITSIKETQGKTADIVSLPFSVAESWNRPTSFDSGEMTKSGGSFSSSDEILMQ